MAAVLMYISRVVRIRIVVTITTPSLFVPPFVRAALPRNPSAGIVVVTHNCKYPFVTHLFVRVRTNIVRPTNHAERTTRRLPSAQRSRLVVVLCCSIYCGSSDRLLMLLRADRSHQQIID